MNDKITISTLELFAPAIEPAAVSRAALQRLYRAYVNLLENGRDRIIERGGQCDPVDVMEARDPVLIEVRAELARPSAALAAPEAAPASPESPT